MSHVLIIGLRGAPAVPPRYVTWPKKGKWVHVAKITFEKYFLHKVRSGNTDPLYERYVLKALGIERLRSSADTVKSH